MARQMSIPIAIVDDQEVDRYLVKRQVSKSGEFGELLEICSGDLFLEIFYSEQAPPIEVDTPMVALMDVNMPGRDGFETAIEAQTRQSQGIGPQSLVIMMFTSSNNDRERKKAEEIDIVKGYISKPITGVSLQLVKDIYLQSF